MMCQLQASSTRWKTSKWTDTLSYCSCGTPPDKRGTIHHYYHRGDRARLSPNCSTVSLTNLWLDFSTSYCSHLQLFQRDLANLHSIVNCLLSIQTLIHIAINHLFLSLILWLPSWRNKDLYYCCSIRISWFEPFDPHCCHMGSLQL